MQNKEKFNVNYKDNSCLKYNSSLISQFINDLSIGKNVSQFLNKPRSPLTIQSYTRILIKYANKMPDKKFNELSIDEIKSLEKISISINGKFNYKCYNILKYFYKWLYRINKVSFCLKEQNININTIKAKRDPYYFDTCWINFKKKLLDKNIEGVSKENLEIITQICLDFEQGKNTSKHAPKGIRSHARLYSLAIILCLFARIINEKKFTDLTKDECHQLFDDMRTGKIKTKYGSNYGNISDYIKDFKTLFNWLIKTKRITENPAEELVQEKLKGPWVYFTEDQLFKLLNSASPEFKPLLLLGLDSGARITETYSLRVCDFSDDFKQVTIREETSKNKYERTINLHLCSDLIKEYVGSYNLKREDFIAQHTPTVTGRYFKHLVKSMFGEGVSNPKSKGRYEDASLYDLRHNASCYWLKRYPDYKSLMYRMGWTSESFIRYYSDFLGMTDVQLEGKPVENSLTDLIKTLQQQIESLNKINYQNN